MGNQGTASSNATSTDRRSLWEILNKGVELYACAVNDQMKRWRAAGDKLGRSQYGPADAVGDVQQAYLSGIRYAMDLARLGWQASMTGAVDLGSWTWPTGTGTGTGTGSAPCAPGTSPAEQEIEARYTLCRQAFLDKNAEKTASFYSPKVTYEAEFQPSLQGVEGSRDQLQKTMAAWFATPGWDCVYDKKNRVVAPSGDMAWEHGTMRMYFDGLPEWMGDRQNPMQCRYMVVWEKVGGQWQMTYDMTNSEQTVAGRIASALSAGAPDRGTAEKEIRARYNACRKAFLAGDAKKTASFYSPDVLYLANGFPEVEGRDALEAMIAEWFKLEGWESTYKLERLTMAPTGDMAWECGTTQTDYKGLADVIGFAPFKGRYLVVWQKVDGEWMMSVDIINMQPPEPPKSKS